MGIISDFYL